MTLDRCSGCHGLWFDLEEIKEYLRAHPSVPDEAVPAEGVIPRCTKGIADECPACQQKNLEFANFRGIGYRRCTWCGGAFLGAEQVKQIVQSRPGQVTVWGIDPPPTVAGVVNSAGRNGVAVVAEGTLDGILGAALEFVAEALLGAIF